MWRTMEKKIERESKNTLAREESGAAVTAETEGERKSKDVMFRSSSKKDARM